MSNCTNCGQQLPDPRDVWIIPALIVYVGIFVGAVWVVAKITTAIASYMNG